MQKPKLFIQAKYVMINYNQTSTNKLNFNMISIFHFIRILMSPRYNYFKCLYEVF